jgi:uncharacterized protein YjgD (DUF1641 family)
MTTDPLQQQIHDIQHKLTFVAEELELQRRHRLEMEELRADLYRVGKDVYQTAVEELEQVHDHVQTSDLLHLGKYLLRNVRTLTAVLHQLESTKDFLKDFTPISRELVFDTMRTLDELDRKGYFEFLRELRAVGDRVVTSFSPDDVRRLGENIVTILTTIKNLTQPDLLQTVNNALSVYKNVDIEMSDRVSFRELAKELNAPETRRSLLFALRFLKNLANAVQSNGHDHNAVQLTEKGTT